MIWKIKFQKFRTQYSIFMVICYVEHFWVKPILIPKCVEIRQFHVPFSGAESNFLDRNTNQIHQICSNLIQNTLNYFIFATISSFVNTTNPQKFIPMNLMTLYLWFLPKPKIIIWKFIFHTIDIILDLFMFLSLLVQKGWNNAEETQKEERKGGKP